MKFDGGMVPPVAMECAVRITALMSDAQNCVLDAMPPDCDLTQRLNVSFLCLKRGSDRACLIQ